MLLVMLATAGCERLPGSAVQQVRQAHSAYERRDYVQSERLLTPVIGAYADSPDVAEALYVRGLCRLKQGSTAAARKDFEAAVRRTQRPELRALLHAQLGNLDFEARRYTQAAGHYHVARGDLPERPPTDRVLLRYAECLQRIGKFREAKLVLAELLLDYPRGQVAAQARNKLSGPQDHFAIQCGVYSKSAYAKRAAEKLRKVGVDARAWEQRRNGALRYVVQTGHFRTYAEARQALPRVRAHVADAFIVP